MVHNIVTILADGFEETEALAPVDLMRRCGFNVRLLTINQTVTVTSSHNITIAADDTINNGFGQYDLIMLPGGMPGTKNLFANQQLREELIKAYSENKWIAAICAAPMILGQLGMLEGRKAICYPGFEQYLEGAQLTNKQVVTDGNIITAIGAGAAFDFGLEIIKNLENIDAANKIAKSIMLK